jgi:hypothetical protein
MLRTPELSFGADAKIPAFVGSRGEPEADADKGQPEDEHGLSWLIATSTARRRDTAENVARAEPLEYSLGTTRTLTWSCAGPCKLRTAN